MNKQRHPHSVLLIMAHGSRKAEANAEFVALVDRIAKQSVNYVIVKHCFLEIASPTMADAIEECLLLGYHQFDLYPLFFNQGNHVSRDIPEQIRQIQDKHRECTIKQLAYFGEHEQLAHMITTHIQQQT
jgi:sirohydrochlorin ferrochelatase